MTKTVVTRQMTVTVALATALALVAMMVMPMTAGAQYTGGNYLFEWGSRGTGDGLFENPSRIEVTDGIVYVADTGNNRVQAFDADGNFIMKWGILGTAEDQLDAPKGVAAGGGYVYVTDTNNHRVQKFDTAGNFISMWGKGVRTGTATFEICTSGCQKGQTGNTGGAIGFPRGIEVDPSSGNVYVALSNHGIIKYDLTGNFIAKLNIGGYAEDVAVDSSGNLYATGNHMVRKVTNTGSPITQWGSLGTTDGAFHNNVGIDVDGSDTVYVVDGDNERIQIFDSSGTFLHKFGSWGSGSSQFLQPNGIAVSADRIYVVDPGAENERVQVFSSLTSAPPISECALEHLDTLGVAPEDASAHLIDSLSLCETSPPGSFVTILPGSTIDERITIDPNLTYIVGHDAIVDAAIKMDSGSGLILGENSQVLGSVKGLKDSADQYLYAAGNSIIDGSVTLALSGQDVSLTRESWLAVQAGKTLQINGSLKITGQWYGFCNTPDSNIRLYPDATLMVDGGVGGSGQVCLGMSDNSELMVVGKLHCSPNGTNSGPQSIPPSATIYVGGQASSYCGPVQPLLIASSGLGNLALYLPLLGLAALGLAVYIPRRKKVTA